MTTPELKNYDNDDLKSAIDCSWRAALAQSIRVVEKHFANASHRKSDSLRRGMYEALKELRELKASLERDIG